MNNGAYQTFLIKKENNNIKPKSLNKDLFSIKLKNTFIFRPLINKKLLPSLKNSSYSNNNVKTIQTIPTNPINTFSSFNQDSKLANIVNNFNISFSPKKNESWLENNIRHLIRTSNRNEIKKEIKDIMNTGQKFYRNLNEKKLYKRIENMNLKKEKERYILKTIENTKNKNLLEELSNVHNHNTIINKDYIKEVFQYGKSYKNEKIRKFNYLRINKNKNKNLEKICIFSPIHKNIDNSISNNNSKFNSYENSNENSNNNSFINEKIDKDSIIFLKKFYEDFIDLYTYYNNKFKYINLINNFNKNYFFNFDIKNFPREDMNNRFLNTYKFSCILDICLIFLIKDRNLYIDTFIKMKEFLEKFIWLNLNSINYKIIQSKKINNFLKNINYIIQEKTLSDILNNIILLLFNEKMDDYRKLRICLRQILYNINSDTPEKMLSIINECILFCHNCSYCSEENDLNEKSKISRSKIDLKENNKNEKKNYEPKIKNFSNNNIKVPYINKEMTQKFCLVLDLDETLMHNLRLPFGDYFLVRPGVFEFLEKIHNLYEIIIFTAGQKNYAYSIIDKIDYNDYIDHILYKKHIIYENGFSVKKLDLIGRDLNKTIFVDNLESNAKYNKKNLYLISSWYNNVYDRELYKLKEKLINIANSGKFNDDITKGLNEN